MNWLLIAVLIILLFFIIRGWRKGLLRILFSLISIVVLIGLVSYATPYVSNFIKTHTGIYTMVERRCSESIQTRIESSLESSTESSSVAGVALPEKIISYITDSGETAIAETGVYQKMGAKAADLVLAGASFFVALILAIVIVKLIDRSLGIVDHIPVLKGLNRTLGLFAGAFEGYIVISLLFLFTALIAGTELGSLLTDNVEENSFLSFLYYNNAILKFFDMNLDVGGGV